MPRYKVLSDPRYRVGDDGSVWSRMGWRGRIGTTWKRLKPSPLSKRYPYSVVGIGGKQFRVGCLVLTYFVGPAPDGCECAHENGKHNDDRLCNLSWKTHVDNCRDRIAHGTQARGSSTNLSKLTESDIPGIRERIAKGETHGSIAKSHKVTRATITYIANGKTWQHVK